MSEPDAPVWWTLLIESIEQRRAELDAAIDAMAPLNLRPEWPGYDVDALEPWGEE